MTIFNIFCMWHQWNTTSFIGHFYGKYLRASGRDCWLRPCQLLKLTKATDKHLTTDVMVLNKNEFSWACLLSWNSLTTGQLRAIHQAVVQNGAKFKIIKIIVRRQYSDAFQYRMIIGWLTKRTSKWVRSAHAGNNRVRYTLRSCRMISESTKGVKAHV